MGGLSRESGVVVEKADTGIAAQLGVNAGDIIVSVNGQKVESVSNLRRIMEDKGTRRWQIQLLRDGQLMNLMITL
jgi:S1-C subfamily serine protease